MRKITTYILSLIALFFVSCESDFLDLSPQGELSEGTLLNSEEGVEGLIIATYSVLNGQIGSASDAYNAPASNWTFGDVVSDDAYKGSSGVSDQEGMHLMEIFETNPTIKDISKKWQTLYEGISRANAAIRAIQNFESWSDEVKNQKLGEVRFLRAHYYFDLKKIYNLVPYIDETIQNPDDLKQVSNHELSSEELWNKIEDDFKFAASVLPDIANDVGRISKGAANAYLAKAYIFQGEWNNTIDACNLVISSPANYNLLNNYGDVFSPEYENSEECIFSIQHSVNDGAGVNGYNGNIGDRLNQVGGPYPRLYGFHRPSQNLVNSYRTDNSGLPLIYSFNNYDLTENDNVDPRLDHNIGRPGIPFLDAGIYKESWNRGNSTYGNFGNKKVMVPVSYEHRLEVSPYTNAKNYCVIRFADILLWKAEALVETNDLEGARTLVNLVRERAKNGSYVTNEDGSPSAKYVINEYQTAWSSQSTARDAVRMERRLEFALEGHRLFDLVRWGNADQMMNEYIRVEKSKRIYLNAANFVKGKNEYFPIPQDEIDLSGGNYTQNPGY